MTEMAKLYEEANLVTRNTAHSSKCCPYFFAADGTTGRCYSDECMMWRWFDKEKDLGFCGLAGKP